MIHLSCCLLPKANRDAMEVLFLFVKWVASFAETSKMDLQNLATVLAPNVLYSKNKDPVKDDSFAAIETVHMLLLHQEEFCTVPDDLVLLLRRLSYGEDDMEASARDILRKCEMVMRLRRSQQGFPSMPARQHSSPAVIPSSISTDRSEAPTFSSSPTEMDGLSHSQQSPYQSPPPPLPLPLPHAHEQQEQNTLSPVPMRTTTVDRL